MADDGLLLNFTAGDAPLTVKPSFKGGNWKERLNVKRNARRRNDRPSSHTENSSHASTGPPLKRLRLETDRNASHGNDVQSSRSQVSAPPKEIISSLFTYNPQSKIEATVDEAVETDVAPSNAPLVDGLDTFTSLGLSSTLAAHLLTKMGLKNPTAIQQSAIKQLTSEDSDAFIQAETGSGKTLAYLLPIVNRIIDISKDLKPRYQDGNDGQIHRGSGLFAIILAPTRELSKQISVVLERILRCAHWIVAGTVIGGESKKSEKARVRKGLNILVATPGRLVDHLANTESLDVSCVRWLVLDEGDRLMELGFEEAIQDVLDHLDKRFREPRRALPGLPSKRTTVLCSATMKTTVEKLGGMSLKDAVHLKSENSDGTSVSAAKESFSAPAQLKQSYIIVPPKQRFVTLAALLKRTFARKGSVTKAIVFVTCADSVDFHFSALTRHKDDSEADTSASASATHGKNNTTTEALASILTSPTNPGLTLYKLHGSLPQTLRTSTLASFSRNTQPSILICTDVASRGLDLPSIDLVIEYDPAFSAEDHLHRIGRTARAGRDGRATIFLMPGPEEAYVEVLEQSYRAELGAKVTRMSADEVLRKGFTPENAPSGSSNKLMKSQQPSWEDAATEFQLDIERWILEDDKAGDMARKAYISHVRAYATHTSSERQMFDVKSLHLGHLAKAFALRDKPGYMGRGASKDKKHGSRDTRKLKKSSDRANDDDYDDDRTQVQIDKAEASRRMRATMKAHMGAANEFNIG